MTSSQSVIYTLEDVWTVARKELVELSMSGIGQWASPLQIAASMLLLGALLAIWQGPSWLDTPAALAFWSAAAAAMAGGAAIDSYVGEREQHTLDALLATRLAEKAILLGKSASTILHTWSMTVIGLVVSVLVVSLTTSSDLSFGISPMLGVVVLVFVPLVAWLAASLGALVCIGTVDQRRACWVLYPITLVCALGLLGGMLAAAQVTPRLWLTPVLNAATAEDMVRSLLVAGSILLVLDVLLLLLAIARFQRQRLILH